MKEDAKKETKKGTIAKKDFRIVQNEYDFQIKKGEDIEKLGIPKHFYENLKVEKVI